MYRLILKLTDELTDMIVTVTVNKPFDTYADCMAFAQVIFEPLIAAPGVVNVGALVSCLPS